MERNILKSSLEYASFRIIFQILFRCVTFILNAWILRIVGAEVLGVMNVRLLLLESTLLFLCKEPCIKACQTNAKHLHWPQVINQIWLTVPACTALSIPLLYIWLNCLSAPRPELLRQYELGCYSIVLSCIIEQITNVPYIIATSYCFVKTNICFDTLYTSIRTIIFVILTVQNKNDALKAFAIAQILSSIFLCALYYGFFWWYIRTINTISKVDKKLIQNKSSIFSKMDDFHFKSIIDFFPGLMENKKSKFNKDLMILSISFGKQCIVKQVLTEGERYVMTISPVLTFSEQATYDVVNNLGSLAARFLFRPIEESAYFYFTQMVRRDTLIAKQDQTKIRETSEVLSQLCAVVCSIGITVLIFGQSYSHCLLSLYGGETLTSTNLPTTLLQCHCIAIILLAINGVTEGYVFATMDNKQLDRYNYLMVIFSISFLLFSYILTYIMGPVGFIMANCINMSARIAHSCYFISNQYRDTSFRPLNGLVPKKSFFVILITSGVLVKLSEIYVYPASMIIHIAFGAVLFAICLVCWMYENQSLLKLGIERYRKRSIVKID